MDNKKTMLTVENLNKSFAQKKVINNLNLSLQEGEIVALLGPNGAGKTTLMRLLTSFYTPDSGTIKIDDLNLQTNRRTFLQKIGYVPESGSLYPEFSVYEYLRFMAQMHHLSQTEFTDNLSSLTQYLDIADVINQKCEFLSKGYKRRVSIAGALIHHPEILILDEPTEGLDPNQKFYIRHFVKEYGKKNIVLISTHIMEEVEAMADRVILLNKGQIVRNLTPEMLKKTTRAGDIESAFRFATISPFAEED